MKRTGGIIGWAVARPVSVSVGVILVIMFGVLSVTGLPIQLTPDVQIPSMTITTNWPGSTPTEVEREILEEQEEALKGLDGLERMTSTARRNSGTIDLELAVGTDLDEALVRVSNLLSQVPDYPENARQPVISTANSAGPPLAVIVIQSAPPGEPVAAYRTFVDEIVVPRFLRIPGVAGIRTVGGQPEEVHVDFGPTELAARGLTVSSLATAIRSQLRDMAAGDLPSGKRAYVVRTAVAPLQPAQLERTVLETGDDGTPVLLGQVADVEIGLRKRDAVGMVNGSPSMALLFFREAGSNVLEVTREIYAVNDELQARYLDAEGLQMTIVSDQVDYITGALELVRSNLLIGGVLAVIVLLLFLRSVGASFVVALSIPISIIGTALVMSLAGRTINIVSLAGMAFAVGMVVDNAIVVLENIDTWRRRIPDVGEAARRGAHEVWGAILASTTTTAAVFIPIIGWQDEVGELLRDVAVAVATAVFVSLVVSVVVIPSFSARLLRSRSKGRVQQEESDLGRVGRAVRWILGSRLRTAAVAVVGLAGPAAAGLALLPPMEYLPTGNRNIVFGVVIPPPGYSVDEMERIGEHVQGRLLEHTGVEKDGIAALARSFFVGTPDQAFLGGVAEDPERVSEVAGLIRSVLREIPDVFAFANQGSLFGRSLGGGRAIELDISGAELDKMLATGRMLMGALSGGLPGAQIRPIPGLDAGAPEFQVEPNRAEAARFGVSAPDIGLTVDAYVDGAIIGELGREGENKRDVVLRARGLAIDDRSSLLAAPVAVPTGAGGLPVPLGELATVTERLGPTVIQRIERRRALTLQISPPDDLALEDAIAAIRDEIVGPMLSSGAIPEGVRVDYSGSAGKLAGAKSRFGWVLLLAVIITFLLLAALFEDFLAPLAILVTVPMAGAGGIIGLRLVDRFLGAQPLDMMTALGFVLLVGVVVNNAILIVDGSLSRMRERGLDLPDAIAAAVRWRVRPILMSALTSLAGLLPLVIFPGFGSELYRGVGGVVLGGLALSTALSLFVVPAVFALLWSARLAISARLDR